MLVWALKAERGECNQCHWWALISPGAHPFVTPTRISLRSGSRWPTPRSLTNEFPLITRMQSALRAQRLGIGVGILGNTGTIPQSALRVERLIIDSRSLQCTEASWFTTHFYPRQPILKSPGSDGANCARLVVRMPTDSSRGTLH